MEVRPLISVEEIIQEATAFYYFYLPALAPSYDPHSLHTLQETREYLNSFLPLHVRAREVFISQVGLLARAKQGISIDLEGLWKWRLTTATKAYNEYLREVRSTREFVQSLVDEDCCSCTLRCMPDPEPCPSTTDLV